MLQQQISIFDFVSTSDKEVRRIDSFSAAPFIREIHYSRKVPNITDAFGLFVNGELIGVVTYGIPASRNLCVGLAGIENVNKVKELNRLVIKPEFNGGGYNYASYLVSHSLKLLDNGTFVVSYADPSWTHVGYVYQACNFIYTGLSVKRVDYYQTDGLHPRSFTKHKHQTEIMQTRMQKHRYVYLVGDKRTKKQMLKQLKYPIVKQYPKGDETHYDVSNPKIVYPVQIVERKKPYKPKTQINNVEENLYEI